MTTSELSGQLARNPATSAALPGGRTQRQRLYALRQLNILDTPPSERFDRITRMAARVFDLPLAAVSVTDQDRQWSKSRVGTDITKVPRTNSPCSDVWASCELVVIEDFPTSDFYIDHVFFGHMPGRHRCDWPTGGISTPVVAIQAVSPPCWICGRRSLVALSRPRPFSDPPVD